MSAKIITTMYVDIAIPIQQILTFTNKTISKLLLLSVSIRASDRHQEKDLCDHPRGIETRF